ncbi:hypothetical protein RDI58_000382 [Solanum bulbocastanum]|uniref:Uncharacterized protein n=1 Tax=Solanum bulbocastanum TaxID=147425 RepID=A0AAN8UAW9_SOLBU
MYVCFQALKNGWRAGLRLFIGLDGTILKWKWVDWCYWLVASKSTS